MAFSFKFCDKTETQLPRGRLAGVWKLPVNLKRDKCLDNSKGSRWHLFEGLPRQAKAWCGRWCGDNPLIMRLQMNAFCLWQAVTVGSNGPQSHARFVPDEGFRMLASRRTGAISLSRLSLIHDKPRINFAADKKSRQRILRQREITSGIGVMSLSEVLQGTFRHPWAARGTKWKWGGRGGGKLWPAFVMQMTIADDSAAAV